jgi:serine/threonine-protein kinase HipA
VSRKWAERIRLLRLDPTAWQPTLEHGQFSLAGAQAKIALFREGGRWGRPSGRIPTSHIIKPAVEGLDDHDLNEHLSLQAAGYIGLRVARSEIVEFGDERAIVIERYDRIQDGHGLMRVHQEDLCQAFGLPPTSKYQREGGPGPTQIVDLLRTTDPAAGPQSVASFVDALAFSWLIGGTDAHGKNYSVLLSGRQVRLAPLYDVASILPYKDFQRPGLKLAMRIGDEYRLDWIAARHWLRMAREMRLDDEALLERVRDLAQRVPEAFARAAKDARVRALDTPLPDRLTDAVTDRASTCLMALREA